MDPLAIAIEAARLGAEAILTSTDHTSTMKADGSPLTPADKASQAAIINYLSEQCPGELIISEEQNNPKLTGRKRWIVDPLDGTNNYRIGNPGYAVNVAREESNTLVYGVMHFPALEKIVVADRQGGKVTINGRACRPFSDDRPTKRRIGLDLHRKITDDFLTNIIGPLLRKCQRYPRNEPTSMSLLDLIEGTTDIYISNNQSIWDPAAGVVGVLALGGEVFTLDGNFPKWDQLKLPVMCYTRSRALKEEVLATLKSAI